MKPCYHKYRTSLFLGLPGEFRSDINIIKDREMGLLNWNKAFALEQAADDAELLQELLDIFKSSFASDLQLIKDGITTHDAGQVGGAAHSIKGAASSLGINGIAELVKQIEEEAKDGGITTAKDNLDQLDEMLAEINTL
jgi:HPt (histidine-containing phosphotransfer) domain-containing protein